VDGLLGTGTRGRVREPFASVIRAVNEAHRPVLAIDIPSGLDPDTGEPLGPAIRAARTVTMAAMKVGFEKAGAAEYTGEVTVADLGVPFDRPPD
jgi:NAD(P)H-hydrate epimerase